MTQIVLIGFMGAGKTAIGKSLAQKLQIPFLDTDQLIEKKVNLSIPKIFEEKGESFFRQQEKEVLNTIKDQSAVISTGGGIILSQESQALLATFANVVFLEVDIDTLVESIKSDANNIRPLFLTHTPEAFQQIYTDRLPLYQKASTLIVTNRGKSIEELTNEIILKVGV